MTTSRNLELEKAWQGPVAYITASSLASLMNLASYTRLEQRISMGELADIRGILSVLTAVSLLGFALQFIFARAIGAMQSGSRTLGFAEVFCISLGISAVTFFAIDSTFRFQISLAAWMGLITLTALLPTGILATFLCNKRWTPICVYTFTVAICRLVLWEIQASTINMNRVLATFVVSNTFAFLVLLYLTRGSHFQEKFSVKFRSQLIPYVTLLSIVVLVTSGSISRRSNLGSSASAFTEATLFGRNLLLATAIISYAVFPFLTSLDLFSRQLGRRFRQTEALIIGVVILLGLLVTTSGFISHDLLGIPAEIDRVLFGTAVLGWSFIAISILPLLYYIAHKSTVGFVTIIPAVGMLLAQILCTTPRQLAIAFLACSSVLLLLTLVPALLRNRPVVRVRNTSTEFQRECHGGALTIIVPSHNSGAFGLATALGVHDLFQLSGIDVRVIAVSDGSTDESVELFNSVSHEWFTHIHLIENKGKGGALLAGFAESTSLVTGFIDADGDIPPHVLAPMYEQMLQRDADVVFGSKWHPESKVMVTKLRRLISHVHHLAQRVLFKIDINDTQVGIKLYRTSALHQVLPTLQESGFSLDVELFVALSAYGHNNFVEMPVEIQRTGSSTITLKNVVISLFDLLRIFWRARVSLNYAAIAYTSKNSLEAS